MSPVPESVLVEVTVSASADDAWDALRDPARIAQWFGWDADTLPGEIAYIFHDHTQVDAPRRTLTFVGMPDRFEVEDIGDGKAVVRLVRSGSARTQTDWEGLYDDMIQGWITFVQQLGFALDRHRDDRRRTLYLSGLADTLQAARPSAAMGLDTIRAAAPGSHYAVEAAGERLSGEVRFVTALQTGLTVDGWGDGLLVLVDRPSIDGQPVGGWAVLTTYGLDDDAFDAFQARWNEWWTTRYPDERPGCMEGPES
ncbi:SRPBCC family protein [Caulobacter mirabilis]|uniref:SRPBCC family protein n=1 Tax=Caulobacter mirabilis TaxID=69666 RepID=UPI0012373CC2|nr:hypothetical protein [Caulobacter mirabilis]